MLSLEFQRRRLQRDLQRLNEEDAEGRRNRGEAADAERAQLEQARLEREERDRQREESERRQFWLDAQIEFALQSIPSDVMAVMREVSSLIAYCICTALTKARSKLLKIQSIQSSEIDAVNA